MDVSMPPAEVRRPEGPVIDLPRASHRFLAYGLVGWAAEIAYTGTRELIVERDRTLQAHTSVWMFPVYGLMQPVYERVHGAVRDRPLVVRLATYGAGFLAAEYLVGRLLRRVLGRAPWDYGGARWNIQGLIRLDYFPLWAAFGLLMERVHDRLAPPRLTGRR